MLTLFNVGGEWLTISTSASTLPIEPWMKLYHTGPAYIFVVAQWFVKIDCIELQNWHVYQCLKNTHSQWGMTNLQSALLLASSMIFSVNNTRILFASSSLLYMYLSLLLSTLILGIRNRTQVESRLQWWNNFYYSSYYLSAF